MAIIDEKNVVTCDGIILWDGITNPEKKEDGSGVKHSLKIAIPANALEKTELEQIANATLAESEFKGVMPANGNWPIQQIDMTKFTEDAARLTGRVAISANTYLGAPDVFDANGQKMEPMQYGQMLYPGAVVKMLVHCYAFNNKAKGLAFGLDGVQIVDATAPKLSVGAGMSTSQKAAAFGGTVASAPTTGAPAVPNPAPAATPGVAPAPDFLSNAAGAPTPPPAPPAEEKYLYNGALYTKAALLQAGWQEAQILALPKA
jgi:hypothetical protein